MPQKTIQLVFFVTLIAGLTVVLFFIFKPYFGVVFISGIFAVTFYPWYEQLAEKFKGRRSLASGVTTLLILIFIIIPVFAILAILLKEAADLYNAIALSDGPQSFIAQANGLVSRFNSLFPPGVLDSEINLGSYVRGILSWITGHFDSIFSTVFGSILKFILMLISLYYFFISGEKIKKTLIFWSPLPDKYDIEFVESLKSSIDAVFRGRILVSLAQGIFIGAGFALFGIGSPVLWGFVGAIASLVPILGTSIITIPAVAYLFLSGNAAAGVGLLIWSIFAVGLIDNVISVIFLKGKIKVHPLIILFSILGGVEVFGAIGFLVGPVIVSAVVALMNVYPYFLSYYKDRQESEHNISGAGDNF